VLSSWRWVILSAVADSPAPEAPSPAASEAIVDGSPEPVVEPKAPKPKKAAPKETEPGPDWIVHTACEGEGCDSCTQGLVAP
jgi:hypothetical protein